MGIVVGFVTDLKANEHPGTFLRTEYEFGEVDRVANREDTAQLELRRVCVRLSTELDNRRLPRTDLV